jgi:hypothetical protein
MTRARLQVGNDERKRFVYYILWASGLCSSSEKTVPAPDGGTLLFSPLAPLYFG